MSRPEKILKDEDIIHKIRVQAGMEKDEIEVLYPTEKDRIDFLAELMEGSKGESADATWEEDDFQLPAEEAKEAQVLLEKAEKKKQAKKARQDALAAAQSKQLAEQTGVSEDDAIAASIEAAKHLDN